MTQPEHVPIQPADRVRRGERVPPPRPWQLHRPADVMAEPQGTAQLGSPGPDQGYALKLARLFDERLVLAAGEHAEDAIAGCVAVALKRASLFHRAPVVYDLELALTVWGFLGDGPDDLVAHRKALFQGAGHRYECQRMIADRVPEATLRMAPAEARAVLGDWRSLLVPE